MDLIEELNSYNNIAIWGYGREGKSVESFIKKHLPNKKITIIENNQLSKKFDLIIKSPGISLFKLGINFNDYNFTSSTELFLKHFGKQTIGITGTKGKSTTTKLIHHLIDNSIMVGNIGIPVFDKIDDIGDKWVVFELSSHQLENCRYSPKIAILTNLFEEHLDFYKDKESYFQAKMNIFQNCEIKIIEFNDKLEICKNREMLEINKNFIHCDTVKIAYKIAKLFKIENFEQKLKTFKTLPHRMEFVTEKNGIKIYNDSISTIPESTIVAVETINPDVVIIGGDDRGVNYQNLIEFLNGLDVEILAIYESGKKITPSLKNATYCKSLEDATLLALQKAKKSILFSPASASYNHFRNFEERGNKFKEFIEKC